jgi:hypothetical protein
MIFVKRDLPEPTIIRRTSAYGVAGNSRAAKILNMTGKELLMTGKEFLRGIYSYLSPPEIPVKVMEMRIEKDGKVSLANMYFSFDRKDKYEVETVDPSSLKFASKNFVLERMFEAADREEDAKDRSFSSTMMIMAFTALSALWGAQLLYSVWDSCPSWVSFFKSPRSPAHYGLLSFLGLAGLYIFTRFKIGEVREIRRHTADKEALITRYLELGERKIPQGYKEQCLRTADNLEWSIRQAVEKMESNEVEK